MFGLGDGRRDLAGLGCRGALRFASYLAPRLRRRRGLFGRRAGTLGRGPAFGTRMRQRRHLARGLGSALVFAGTRRVGSAARFGIARPRAFRRYRCGAGKRGFGRRAPFHFLGQRVEHFATFRLVSRERNEPFHGGKSYEAGEKSHGLDAFEEGGITFVLTLRDDALQRQDALARQLDDPALRAFVLRPGLHVPVARVVERRITGMQVEADLPAFEQRFELARLFAGQGLSGHAGQGTAPAPGYPRCGAHPGVRNRGICA